MSQPRLILMKNRPYWNPTPELLKSRIRIIPCNTPWNNGCSALGQASSEGDIDRVKQLLADGAKVNVQNEYDGMSPLHLAQDVEIAKLLIQAGADVKSQATSYKRTPLHHANNAELAEVLILAGADTNAKDTCGDTPLHLAIIQSRFNVIKRLVELGADVNLLNKKGRTPLIMLIKKLKYVSNDAEFVRIEKNGQFPERPRYTKHIQISEYVQIAKLLLLKGADHFIRNHKNRNAFDVAQRGSLMERCLDLFKRCRTCWEIWEMDEETFMFFLQWLPEEVNEDVMIWVFNTN